MKSKITFCILSSRVVFVSLMLQIARVVVPGQNSAKNGFNKQKNSKSKKPGNLDCSKTRFCNGCIPFWLVCHISYNSESFPKSSTRITSQFF